VRATDRNKAYIKDDEVFMPGFLAVYAYTQQAMLGQNTKAAI